MIDYFYVMIFVYIVWSYRLFHSFGWHLYKIIIFGFNIISFIEFPSTAYHSRAKECKYCTGSWGYEIRCLQELILLICIFINIYTHYDVYISLQTSKNKSYKSNPPPPIICKIIKVNYIFWFFEISISLFFYFLTL